MENVAFRRKPTTRFVRNLRRSCSDEVAQEIPKCSSPFAEPPESLRSPISFISPSIQRRLVVVTHACWLLRSDIQRFVQ